jgi:hypothetical protein
VEVITWEREVPVVVAHVREVWAIRVVLAKAVKVAEAAKAAVKFFTR